MLLMRKLPLLAWWVGTILSFSKHWHDLTINTPHDMLHVEIAIILYVALWRMQSVTWQHVNFPSYMWHFAYMHTCNVYAICEHVIFPSYHMWHFACTMWHVTCAICQLVWHFACDMWHHICHGATCEVSSYMWHFACDMWQMQSVTEQLVTCTLHLPAAPFCILLLLPSYHTCDTWHLICDILCVIFESKK